MTLLALVDPERVVQDVAPGDWVTAIVAVIGSIVVLWVGLLTFRGGKNSSKQTREATFMTDVLKRLGEAETRADAFQDDIDKLRKDHRDEVDKMQKRIESVETELRKTSRMLDVGIAFIERLLDAWPTGGAAPPDVPAELAARLHPTVAEDFRHPPHPAGGDTL